MERLGWTDDDRAETRVLGVKVKVLLRQDRAGDRKHSTFVSLRIGAMHGVEGDARNEPLSSSPHLEFARFAYDQGRSTTRYSTIARAFGPWVQSAVRT